MVKHCCFQSYKKLCHIDTMSFVVPVHPFCRKPQWRKWSGISNKTQSSPRITKSRICPISFEEDCKEVQSEASQGDSKTQVHN